MTNPAETDLTGAQRSELTRLVRDEPLMTTITSREALERLRIAKIIDPEAYEPSIYDRTVRQVRAEVKAREILSTLLASHEALRKALEQISVGCELLATDPREFADYATEIARQALGAPYHG